MIFAVALCFLFVIGNLEYWVRTGSMNWSTARHAFQDTLIIPMAPWMALAQYASVRRVSLPDVALALLAAAAFAQYGFLERRTHYQ